MAKHKQHRKQVTEETVVQETVPVTEEKPKKVKTPRVTISAFMVEVLRMKTVPPNDEIIRMVKAKFPESRFSETHAAWYKTAFQAGRLHGQEGKGETFNQPVVSEAGRIRREAAEIRKTALEQARNLRLEAKNKVAQA